MASNQTQEGFFGNKDLDWFVRFRDPREIYKYHHAFLMNEIYYYIAALLTLIHALRNGGRYKWLWLGAILHGLTTEMVSYWVPDIDNFWHAQGMVMLLGQRLPLYVVVLYAVFIYTASVAVAHMRLKWWAEPFAVGLTVVLIDIPYDIMGIKCLFWTWHDTDPNVYDRHYYVPWTSYYFHASFACGFTFAFHGIRKLMAGHLHKFQSASFPVEVISVVLAGLLGFPLGVLQFIPIYNHLHDLHNIHTEVCVALVMSVYVMIIWCADRSPVEGSRTVERKRKLQNEIFLLMLLHYGWFVGLACTAQPSAVQSIGLHEPVGDCQETVPVVTSTGHVLAKQKYLCVEKYDEPYFDFHCVKDLPSPGQHWYTVCGTPFQNHLEYIVVVCAFSFFGMNWFWQLLTRSGSLPKPKPVKPKQS